MGKNKSLKRKRAVLEIVKKDDENVPLAPVKMSDEPVPKKEKWTNKQRVLCFAARGINHRDRHLMRDIRTLMPHHRPDSKMERSKTLSVINELCDMKHCNKTILFEGRRKQDLYMWMANVPDGPSAKFHVTNIHTLGELKLTGNCLRGSRPLLSFDKNFSDLPYLQLLKELFVQIFGVPNYHPKSQPFIDHVYTFSFVDKRIWFRNYQILSEDGGLSEIGPRFVMNPVKIFDGSFGGRTLWENPDYVSPSKFRQMIKKKAKDRYVNRIDQKASYEATKPETSYVFGELDDLFQGDAKKVATKLAVKTSQKSGNDDEEPMEGADDDDQNNSNESNDDDDDDDIDEIEEIEASVDSTKNVVAPKKKKQIPNLNIVKKLINQQKKKNPSVNGNKNIIINKKKNGKISKAKGNKSGKAPKRKVTKV